MRVELKLATGKVVDWDGADELDAAYRYVDCHRDAAVIATREVRHGIFQYGRGARIEQ